MDFHILGPIWATDGAGPVELGGAKQRALLGMLLLHANEVVSSDSLIDELWSGERREEAARALQVAVSRLRTALRPGRAAGGDGGFVLTRSPGYELRVDPERLDLTRFQVLVAADGGPLEEGDPRAARAKLTDALSLWHGRPLADLAYESFCQNEIARLEEMHLTALEDRIEADLALGHHSELVGELQTLVSEQPLRERLRLQLMLALYRSGRQAEALEAYGETRRLLVEQLGIEPGRDLQELQKAILSQDPALELDQQEERVPARVPASDRLVGREREMDELLSLLDRTRSGHGALALIGGEPGVGKTRLAEAFTEKARERGSLVLVGRCWEAGGAPPYWPWVQALRTYVREADPGSLRPLAGPDGSELANIVPELRELVPGLSSSPRPSSPEGARFRLFESVSSFLRSLAAVSRSRWSWTTFTRPTRVPCCCSVSSPRTSPAPASSSSAATATRRSEPITRSPTRCPNWHGSTRYGDSLSVVSAKPISLGCSS